MEPQNEHGVLFREVQRFRQPVLWILFLFDLLVIIGVGWLILPHEGVGSAAFVSYVVGAFLFAFGPPILLFILRLVTEVRRDGIYYRFVPVHLSFHRITFENLESYHARSYSPLREYGGWGIRWGFKRGWAYNVGGNQGVQLELSDGKRILFGSQRAEGFVKAIDEALGKTQ